MVERIENIKSVINNKEYKEEGNLIIAIIVGVLLIIISFVFIIGFDLILTQAIVFILLLIAFYIIVISFLFENKIAREIINTITKIEEKNYKEDKQVIKKVNQPVIYEIEKPVIKEIIKPIDRMVLLKKDKLVILKYEYVGSKETMNFHKRSCRLSKLIKKKYKIQNDSYNYFIKNGFAPCKVCIQKLKKV